jgi:hypothetical protein
VRGFDALSVPNVDQYKTLRDLGFEFSAGYTRALTIQAIAEALGLGMAVLPIDEAGSPTDPSYFTPQRGHDEGVAFVAWAESVGMPRGVPFVGIPLDFDCPVSALPGILPYANEKISALAGRNPIWMYGPFDCIEAAAAGRQPDGTHTDPWGGVAGFMQAQADAWSGGRNAHASAYADIVQVGGATIAGISLDVQVVRTSARLWRLA